MCYEATADGDIFYGLASRVEGEWFVTVPTGEPITTVCRTKNKSHSGYLIESGATP